MAMLYVSGNPDVIRDLRQRAEEGGACIDLYTERDFPLEDRSEITLSRKHAREIAMLMHCGHTTIQDSMALRLMSWTTLKH